MKTKIFEKKLNLNKKTIANLKPGEMAQANGGGSLDPNPYTILTGCTDECTNSCVVCW